MNGPSPSHVSDTSRSWGVYGIPRGGFRGRRSRRKCLSIHLGGRRLGSLISRTGAGRGSSVRYHRGRLAGLFEVGGKSFDLDFEIRYLLGQLAFAVLW